MAPQTDVLPLSGSDETILRGDTRVTPSSIYRRLLRSIRDGSIRPGDKLPDERSLARQLKTSRSAVRSALSMMEDNKLITRRIGSGTFLAENAGDIFGRLDLMPLPDHQSVPSFLEILEMRILFEPALLALAAARVEKTDIDRMNEALENVSDAASWLEFKESIYRVNRLLIGAVRNKFANQVFDLVVTDRRTVGFDGKDTNKPVPLPVRQQAADDLRVIVEAVASQQPAKAEKAMQNYLLRMLATVNL